MTIVKRFIRWLLQWLIGIAMLVAIAAGIANYVFHHQYPIQSKVLSAYEDKVKTCHIHPLTYPQIPRGFRNALIATEDRRFSWDPGFDPVGIARSIIVDVENDGYIEGGSTLTQQLADNTLLSQKKTFTRKLKQLIVATGIYDTFSKDDTLTMYTNVVYFGSGAYGLYNAAKTYFGRTPDELNSGELAMLAGLPNAPSAYDPFHSLKLARERQQIVVQNMVDDGLMTQTTAAKVLNMPIRLRHSEQ